MPIMAKNQSTKTHIPIVHNHMVETKYGNVQTHKNVTIEYIPSITTINEKTCKVEVRTYAMREILLFKGPTKLKGESIQC